MGISDWDITSGGDGAVIHSAFQHINVPDQQLTHDSWVRKLDNVGGAGFGRHQFLYGTGATDYAEFDLVSDVSIRAAFCMGLRSADSILALGVRMEAGAPVSTSNIGRISDEGYQMLLYEAGTSWRATLNRYNSGVGVVLDDVELDTGVADQYKWFHLRLDVLIQPNGDVTLQVFENDLVANPIDPGNSPTWGASWVKIMEENDIASNVPSYSRVGWGGQINPGAGNVYETYTDWVEAWYS